LKLFERRIIGCLTKYILYNYIYYLMIRSQRVGLHYTYIPCAHIYAVGIGVIRRRQKVNIRSLKS